MEIFSDQKIVDSWKSNVKPWITAIRANEIESRVLITNNAVIEAITGLNPKSVLDAGCGEGWLVRELYKRGIPAFGVDAVEEFIISAEYLGGGRFQTIPYEDLSYKSLNEQFDVVVCNFSLLGNESVTGLFERVPFLLNTGGSFIVQTVHPVVGGGKSDYADGWKEGSWEGFSKSFTNPAPWYFRTIATWKSLFINNGFIISEIIEPVIPETQIPASILFIGVKDD